jgi:galactokinase
MGGTGPGRAQTWSAPGRVNLIGDHTDYNCGFALPFALPQRTTVTARPRTDGRLRATSGDLEPADFPTGTQPGDVTGWAAYVAGIAWVLGEHLGAPLAGADLEITSEVPVGTGLSSSHSLECAVALALLGLAGAEVPLDELALLVQRAENHYVGAPTGLLDQTAILRSRAGHLSFFDARDVTVEPVPCDLDAAGLALLVIDPHAPHTLVDGGYASRRRACERAARELGVASLREVEDVDAALAALRDDETRRRARHVLTENQRVLACVDLARLGDLAAMGPLMTASHASMRDDFDNSVPTVDLVVESALAGGALGARMTGGGFGGAVVALVPRDAAAEVRRAVAAAATEAGLREPEVMDVVPSRGAGRD